jgi:DNA replication protein DnaC
MNNQTIEKMHQMKLHTMAVAFKEELDRPNNTELAFEDRIALLVEREWLYRENRRLGTRLKAAKLRHQAVLEDIDFRHPRELDKSMILTLSSCQWIKSHHNVIITGPTGIGKSYIASALADKACREGYTARYYRASRLLQELAMARGDGSYASLLQTIAKTDLLVIDDWGLAPLDALERRDVLEIMEDRYGLRSTIITSQFPVSTWHELVGEPTLADAILDRIIHNAYKIPLDGDSMRKTKTTLTDAAH